MTLLSAASILVGIVNVGLSIRNAYLVDWENCPNKALNHITGLASLMWVMIAMVSFDVTQIYNFSVSHLQEFGHLMASAYMTAILSFLRTYGGKQ